MILFDRHARAVAGLHEIAEDFVAGDGGDADLFDFEPAGDVGQWIAGS